MSADRLKGCTAHVVTFIFENRAAQADGKVSVPINAGSGQTAMSLESLSLPDGASFLAVDTLNFNSVTTFVESYNMDPCGSNR